LTGDVAALAEVSRIALKGLSPGGRRGRLSVFIFHRVLASPDPLLPFEPDAIQFDRIVGFISRCFTVLRLGEAVSRLVAQTLPPAAAAITFDDGYLDNFTVALPILRRYNVPVTVFVATGFLDGGRMWNDDIIEAVRCAPGPTLDWSRYGLGVHEIGSADTRVRCYSDVLSKLKYADHAARATHAREIASCAGVPEASTLMMTGLQVRELRRQGVEIGAHTHTHPILNSIDDDAARREIDDGRARLEALLGEPVDLFAYPNGVPGKDFSARHVDMVRAAGFSAAVTTASGAARTGGDPFLLPRFTPWDRSMWKFAARCAVNLGHRQAERQPVL
jgi:peptidoglycan/xylan/chitin deacetylase (PgdA/CDA1 family)